MDTNYPAGDAGPSRPLARPRQGRALAGVAASLSSYLDVDVAVIRIGFVVLSLFGGIGVPAYLACWLLIPEEGADVPLADGVLDWAGDLASRAEDHLAAGRYR